jgi:hypothetical protein
MRRGLMGWNPEELPQSVLDARLARLRDAMQREGLDAFLFYTNLVQPSAVTWLTGFTPYWSDGMLLVGREGAPVFATALSKRVAGWIRSTNGVSEIVSTPKPGAAVGQRLAGNGAKRVGVLELDRLPAGLYDEVVGAADVTLSDASDVFAITRRGIDDAERRLIARADTIAVDALGRIDAAQASDAGATAGLVEQHARLAGAEEAYIHVAADLDADRRMIRVSKPLRLAGRFAVRASVAYKGSWVRRIGSFAKDAAGRDAVTRGDTWLGGVVASLDAGKPLATQIAACVGSLPGAVLKSWLAESSIGSYPLQAIADGAAPETVPLAAGSFLVLTIELAIDGVPWLGAAPAFVRE